MKRARKLPAPPSPAPCYSDNEAWLDLWLHADRDPRRRPAPSYLESLTRGMRMVIETDDDDERDEILTAIGGIMSARKAAHAAADVYLTARSVLDGAIARRAGEEDDDEYEEVPAPEHDEEPPPWEQTTRPAAPDTGASPPRLDWTDRATCRAWLDDLHANVRDLESAAEDQAAAPSKRRLGRAAAAQLIGEAASALDEMIAYAARGLSDAPPDAGPLH